MPDEPVSWAPKTQNMTTVTTVDDLQEETLGAKGTFRAEGTFTSVGDYVNCLVRWLVAWVDRRMLQRHSHRTRFESFMWILLFRVTKS